MRPNVPLAGPQTALLSLVVNSSEPPHWSRAPVVAIGLATVYGLLLYAVAAHLESWGGKGSGFMTFSFLFGVPLFAPSIAIRLIDPAGRLSQARHGWIGLGVFVALTLAALAVDGLGICLVMVSPIYLVASIVSAMATGGIMRDRSTLQMQALIALPLLLLPVEGAMLPPVQSVSEETSIVIAAPPERVWKQLVEVRDIAPAEQVTTFAQDIVGIPKPVDARLVGRGVGAVRHVRWGRGINFEERVTEWQPNHRLAWRFAFHPGSFGTAIDDHIDPDSDYLKVDAGTYTLQPVAGGTKLSLRTDYLLATRLNWYCIAWGRLLIGDFHRNVLHVIRERSERRALASAAPLA
ncbi:MAG: hypothetical protein CFE37_11000 [Alphaproteobacteria bacterium PA4]|nr:MAG: hypothetical protein CFE37_11000 [Alphaproteobacteria bacterium PA4]